MPLLCSLLSLLSSLVLLEAEPTVLQAPLSVVKLEACNWFGHIGSLYIVVVVKVLWMVYGVVG